VTSGNGSTNHTFTVPRRVKDRVQAPQFLCRRVNAVKVRRCLSALWIRSKVLVLSPLTHKERAWIHSQALVTAKRYTSESIGVVRVTLHEW
jgi:hypothetical protein